MSIREPGPSKHWFQTSLGRTCQCCKNISLYVTQLLPACLPQLAAEICLPLSKGTIVISICFQTPSNFHCSLHVWLRFSMGIELSPSTISCERPRSLQLEVLTEVLLFNYFCLSGLDQSTFSGYAIAMIPWSL